MKTDVCRFVTAVSGLPPIFFLVFQRMLPESPYYLYNKGMHREAKMVLDNIAKVNKVRQKKQMGDK